MWYLESPFIYYPLYSYMMSIETLAARDSFKRLYMALLSL